MVQLSHLYMLIGKTTMLTIWTFVGKVMSLLFNTLSRFVRAFFPRSKCNLISCLQLPFAVILKCHCFDFFFYYLPWSDGTRIHDLSFLNVSFKPAFSLSSFTFIKRLFISSSLSAIRVVSSAWLRLLLFLPAILVPACDSSSPEFCMMYSAYKLNKQGDSIQPCYTLLWILNQSIFPYPVPTVAFWPANRFLRRQVRWSDIPISLRIFHSLLWSIQSKVFMQSKKQMFFCNSLAFFMIQQKLAIWSLTTLPFLKLALHLEVLSSCTADAWFGEFWALFC